MIGQQLHVLRAVAISAQYDDGGEWWCSTAISAHRADGVFEGRALVLSCEGTSSKLVFRNAKSYRMSRW